MTNSTTFSSKPEILENLRKAVDAETYRSVVACPLTAECLASFTRFATDAKEMGLARLPVEPITQEGIHVLFAEDGADEAGDDATLGDLEMYFDLSGGVTLTYNKGLNRDGGSLLQGEGVMEGCDSIVPARWVEAAVLRQDSPNPEHLGFALKDDGVSGPRFLGEVTSSHTP